MKGWRRLVTRWRWEAVLLVCIVVTLGVLAMSEAGSQRLSSNYSQALRSMWAASRLADLRALVVDAETGQRGYLLTRRVSYLEPYENALKRIGALQQELREYYGQHHDADTLASFGRVDSLIAARLEEIDTTLKLAYRADESELREWLNSGVGKRTMDQATSALREMQVIELDRTATLLNDLRSSYMLSRFGIATITALNIILLVLIVRWLKQDWQRTQTRTRELDHMVQQRTTQLASLSTYLQQVSETEKTRLGRELHDELGAILTASRLDLLWVRGRLSGEQRPLLDKLQRALANLDQGIAIKRRIIEDLRPSILSSFGLMTAAREMAQQAAERAGWTLELVLPENDPDLSEEAEIAMFRILQEALTNASKYAKATRVRIKLDCGCDADASCTLEIEDDGIGFDQRKIRSDAHGLVGMQQRLEAKGGRLIIRSQPGRGTLVRAILPLGTSAPTTTPDPLASED